METRTWYTVARIWGTANCIWRILRLSKNISRYRSLVGLIFPVFSLPAPSGTSLTVFLISCHTQPSHLCGKCFISTTCSLSSPKCILLDPCGVPFWSPLGLAFTLGPAAVGDLVQSDQHSFQKSESSRTLSQSQSNTFCFLSTLQNSWTFTHALTAKTMRTIKPEVHPLALGDGNTMLSYLTQRNSFVHILEHSSEGPSRLDHQLPIAQASSTTCFCTGFPSLRVLFLYHTPLL